MANRLFVDEMGEVAHAIVWRYVNGNMKLVTEGWLDRKISDEDIDEFLQKWGATIEHFGLDLINWVADMSEIKAYRESQEEA